jgi:hypothetical protein
MLEKEPFLRTIKKGVEIRPDYTGTAKIWDKDFYLSAWLKTSQGGKKYMSLVFNAKESGNQSPVQLSGKINTDVSGHQSNTDSDIPF